MSLEVQFQLKPRLVVRSDGLKAADIGSGRRAPVTMALALAIHFDDLMRQGEAANYSDVARLSCLSRERVSQIMRLNYLAPDIQVELLYLPALPTGKYPISEAATRGVANLLGWAAQRQAWMDLKKSHGVA